MQVSFERLIAIALLVLLIAFIVGAITSRNKQLRSYLIFGAIPAMLLIFIPIAWRIAEDYNRKDEEEVIPLSMGEHPEYAYNYQSDAPLSFYNNERIPLSTDTVTIVDPGMTKKAAAKDKAIRKPGNIDSAKPAITITENAIANKAEETKKTEFEMDTLADISDDKNIRFRRVVTAYRNGIIVSPIKGDWDKMFVICPKSLTGKIKGLIQPDFAGVGYTSSVTGEIVLNDKKYDIVKIVVVGTKASFRTPYYISFQYNPEFLIFGDYNNKNKWYVYRDGRVNYVSQPFGPDKLKLNDQP